MRSIESTGRSIDEAIFHGLQQLEISIDGVEIEILQQESKGILGIGARPAKVRLTEREPEEVIMPDYPLLPQHPHPEALERIIQLAMSISDLSVIAGDSAGGFLALHTASALRDKPDLMLIYPVVMPGFITASMETFRSAPMWSGRNNEWMVKHYLRGKQVPIPCLKGIGKAFVETAEYDPLHDEGILIREKLMEAGAVTELSETEGTVHGYDILWNRPYVRLLREKRLTWLGSL